MWVHWQTGDVWSSEGAYVYFVIIQMINKAETLKGLERYHKQYR